MDRLSSTTAALMLTIGFHSGCSGDQAGGTSDATTAGSGGSTGQGGAGSTSSSSSSSSGAITSSSSGGTGGTIAPVVCDPPAAPGSLYEIADVSYDINQIDPVPMCKYRGKVMLIVNTAAA